MCSCTAVWTVILLLALSLTWNSGSQGGPVLEPHSLSGSFAVHAWVGVAVEGNGTGRVLRTINAGLSWQVLPMHTAVGNSTPGPTPTGRPLQLQDVSS